MLPFSFPPSPSASHLPPLRIPALLPPSSTTSPTLLLLHGTSTTGPLFSQHLSHLPHNLPHTPLLFPTGSSRFITVIDRTANAWFDIASFSNRALHQELSIPGLRESVLCLARLVVSELGKGGMVVAGYSSGAAMMGILLLSGEIDHLLSLSTLHSPNSVPEVAIKGWVGLSGYLPFRAEISSSISHLPSEDLRNRRKVVRRFVRDLLGLESWEPEEGEVGGDEDDRKWEEMKIWMGHGERDEKVPMKLGEGWRDLLGRELGLDVRWRGFEGVDHGWGGGKGVASDVALGYRELVERGGRDEISKL